MSMFYPFHERYGSGKSQNYLWYWLTPLKIEYATDIADHTVKTNMIVSPIAAPMIFLAPLEIQDTLSHTWEAHTNVMSRMKEIGATFEQETAMGVKRHKVDTSLIYQDTDRRQVELMVYLAAYKDPKKEVLDPVRDLQRYSCPNLEQAGVVGSMTEQPTVFNVTTRNGSGEEVGIINIKHAALTSVQPSWKGPYFKGKYPSYCELSLSFRDLNPISKDSYPDDVAVLTIG